MSNKPIAIVMGGQPLFSPPLHVDLFEITPQHPQNYFAFGLLNHKLIFLNPNWFRCVLHAIDLPGINFVQPFQRIYYADKVGTIVQTKSGMVYADALGDVSDAEQNNWFVKSSYLKIKPSAEYGWTSIPGDVICMT